MRNLVWTTVPLVSIFALSTVVGCIPPADDDDTPTPTPVPTESPAPTDEPYSPPPIVKQVAITGNVIAVDRDTSAVLTLEEYQQRAGAIMVYAVKDPTDLVHILGKATLAAPGYYSLDVPEDSGKVYIVAVADWDKNNVITSVDIAREAGSSVDIGTSGASGMDVTLDLGLHGGGGGGSVDIAAFGGTVTYDAPAAATTDIAVVAFSGDYGGWVWGKDVREGSGDFNVSIGIYGGATSLVGYADADNNGVFEPCDPAGLAEENPYTLSTSGRTGVNILIKGIGPIGLPQPIPYITVSGTVTGDESYTGTPVKVSMLNVGGLLYANTEIEAAGDFSLRVPGNLPQVSFLAITDSDLNGVFDVTRDASAVYGPIDLGSTNLGGVNLQLENPRTGIQGTISYDGIVGPNDQLVVAVLDPDELLVDELFLPASFPSSYAFDLFPGTYFVMAALDVNGDMAENTPPGAEDIVGAYHAANSLLPITVGDYQLISGIDFQIGNYSITE